MKRNDLAKWIAGIFGLEILDAELSELVEEEEEERKEEMKVRELLTKKRVLMEKLSAGLSNTTEIHQIYTAKNMLNLIFGKEGLIKINEKLKGIDKRLKDENKKELESLKKERKELKKEGLDEAFGIEQRIYMIHKEMKGLFELLEDRIREEKKILSDKKTFGNLLQNTMASMNMIKELNQTIAELRTELVKHPHEAIKHNWQDKIIKKFDDINRLSMSAAERKELLTHIRKHLTNPIKTTYKEETRWVDELEMRLERYEHMKKAHEWENKLEKAAWDLSEEIRKEKMIQKHMEKAMMIIEQEMKRFKTALEGKTRAVT